MQAVILVVHLVVALSIIALVLVQRSEGGGLGIGGSGGMGNLMSPRGTANFLTRLTAVLATVFMITSLTLAIMAGSGRKPDTSILDLTAPVVPAVETPAAPVESSVPSEPDAQKSIQESLPQPPVSQ